MRHRMARFPHLFARGTSWCLGQAWKTYAATLILLLIAVLSASRLAVDPSPEAYLKDTPEWQAFARIDHTYRIGEAIVVALREPGGTVFDAETVRTVAELDRVIRKLPGVTSVLS